MEYFNKDDLSKDIHTIIHEPFAIVLEASVSGGYCWDVSEIDENLDITIDMNINNDFTTSHDKDIIGAPVLMMFVFTSKHIGTMHATLVHKRPWENKCLPFLESLKKI